ncbi:sulfur reduction protein DsrJ [Chromatium weissei]|nr:sulfur reduction protein DsrJ [Chromatium weissei]
MATVLKTCLVAAGLVWALAAQTVQAEEMKRYVVEGSRAATLPSCVEPTELMRRQHMEFIKHQRIATVHEGIRKEKYGLSGCVDCHISYSAERIPQPINQADQFCGACHAFAAVNLNCFDCHASVPNGTPLDAAAAHEAAGVAAQVQSHRDGEDH